MKKRVAPGSSACGIEILEERVAPAGVVTGTFAGGVLTLTGDGGDNDITLFSPAVGSYQILGNNGTTIVLNDAGASPSVFIEGPIKSITSQMGAGNDRVEIAYVDVSGALSVDGGDGNDRLILSNSRIAGALTFTGGIGDDEVSSILGTLQVGGTAVVELGDGTNYAQFSDSIFAGLLTINAGTGIDEVTLGGAHFEAKGMNANLGDGDNKLVVSAQQARFGGPVSITHGNHAGTAATNFLVPRELLVKGGVTISYGTGSSETGINGVGGNFVEINGALKVTSAGGEDAFHLGSGSGVAIVTKGINLALGDGENVYGFDGFSLATSALTITGGGGVDSIEVSTTSVRVGAVTFALGDGNNESSFSPAEFLATGLIKVSSGSGDDSLGFFSNDARLPKGVQFLGGDGVNSFTVDGVAWQSGAVKVEYGEHAAGVSEVVFDGRTMTIAGVLSVTGKGGDESVGLHAATVVVKSVTTALGDGANSVLLAGDSMRVGSLGVTGGSGADTLTISGGEKFIGGLKAVLGDGNNLVISTGSSLILGSKLSVTGGSGDDIVGFANLVQRFGGGAVLTLGDGLSIGQFVGVSTFGGAVKFTAGDHASGTSKFEAIGTSLHFSGPLSATFAGGDNLVSVWAQASGRLPSVKVVGGNGIDDFLLRGSNDFVIGAVSFNGGGGTNTTVVQNASGSIGAVNYIGGDGSDTLAVSLTGGKASAITANFGTGEYIFSAAGQGPNRFGGPIKVQSANGDGQAGTIFLGGIAAGVFSAKTGAGIDTVTVGDSIFSSAFTLDTQGGNDVINIETTENMGGTLFLAPVNIFLGEGADILSIGLNKPTAFADFRSVVKFDGGDGFDTAHISTAAWGNIYIPGQPSALPSIDLRD